VSRRLLFRKPDIGVSTRSNLITRLSGGEKPLSVYPSVLVRRHSHTHTHTCTLINGYNKSIGIRWEGGTDVICKLLSPS